MHYGKRKDENHKQIALDLQKVGVDLVDLSDTGAGVCDLLTHFRDTVLIELKFGGKAELKRSQIELMARWTGYIGVATSFDEAEKLAKHPDEFALTFGQQERLRQFLVRWEGKRLHFATFKKVIEGEK